MDASVGPSALVFAAAASLVTAFIHKKRSSSSRPAAGSAQQPVTLRAAIAACAEASTDTSRVLSKLDRIVSGGLENLAVVMDFDRTISSFIGPNGKRGVTCHGTLEVGQSEETRARAQAFNAYYYPIEVDPKRTEEEKLPLMVEWYRSINNLFVEVGFKRKQLAASVAGANLQLRPGATAIMDFCAATGVPLVIFSAGVGDVIKEVLRQKWPGCAASGGKLPANFRVFSNWMRFAAAPGASADAASGSTSASASGTAVEKAPSADCDACAPPGSSPVASPEAAPLEQAPSTGLSLKDGDAVLVGWSDVIHMFNKHEDAALRIDPAMRPLWRRNVLLVGDSVGDATMAREIGEPIPIGASVPSSPAGSSPASTPLPDSDAAVGVGGAGAMPVARAEGTAGAGAMPSLASAATTAASTAGKHASPSAGHAAVLRVGIINDGDALEALRPKYRPAFDVLLERDPPLHVLVDLLRALPKAANAPLSA